MVEEKTYRNPLVRDGDSQNDRLLKALMPDYVKVDERSRNDLVCFAKKYAKLIQYYDKNHLRTSSWEVFFNDETKKDQPHFTLFLAFLRLFRYAQNDINTITGRHLDYYYKEILKLRSNPAIPDTSHLLFKLAKNTDRHLINKGTLLKAGKDDLGKDLFYATDHDLVVNKSSIESFKTIFVESLEQTDGSLKKIEGYGVYAAPIANSTDGIGADLDAEELNWKTFGTSQSGTQIDQAVPKATIGFAIASPILHLKEWKRGIILRLTFDSKITVNFLPYFFSNVIQTSKFTVNDIKALESILIRDLSTKGKPLSEEDIKLLADVKAEIMAKAPSLNVDIVAQIEGSTDTKKYLETGLKIACKTQLVDAFIVSLTGSKGWLEPMTINGILASDRQIELVINLSHEDPAVVAYNTDVLMDQFDTNSPVVKVLLNNELAEEATSLRFHYHFLKDLNLKAISIKVEVEGIKSLLLQSDQATLDANKPFMPYGPIPSIGSNLYIGSEEAFQKKLDNFSLNFNWKDVPSDLQTHYTSYNTALNEASPDSIIDPIKNNIFTSKIQLLKDLGWKDLSIRSDGTSHTNGIFSLFDEEDATLTRTVEVFPRKTDNLPDYERAPSFQPIKQYDNTTLTGFIRLHLNGPAIKDFNAFGHKWYPKLYTETIVKKVTDVTFTDPLPNEPYTPIIDSMSLNYESSVFIHINGHSDEQEEYFHIAPFGHRKRSFLTTEKESLTMLPCYEDEGTLYLGISELQAPQNVSVLFQMNEKSVNHEFVGKVEVNWSYLSKNSWKDFTAKQILSDTTDLLTKSGIIRFDVPKDITDGNTLLAKDLYWLRATVAANTRGVADAISIKAQAVTATFMDLGNDPKHLAKPLQSTSIKKFKINDAAVKSIEQPYVSFDGELKENNASFYTRVSERLRHKRRAISIWDYERLILATFPTIYKVKCLNHTFFPTGATINCHTEMTPGAVTIIVIPKVEEASVLESKLAPITNVITINRIKKYLSEITSPFIALRQKLVVRNPVYEEVKIKCNVKFHPGYDIGYYKKELETDIKKFLSPWAFNDDRDITFERKIYKSVVIDYIEELPYINFVCCFEMYHLTSENQEETDTDTIEASHPAAILIAHETYKINYVEGNICTCKEVEDDLKPIPVRGIGVMIVGIDFNVS